MDEQRVAASAAYLLAVLVLSLVVSDLSSAGVAPTPPEVLSSPAAAGEAEALLAVKAAPHDTANVLADWNAGFGVSDGGPCNWSMVACSEAGHMDGSTGMPRWASARFLGYDIDLSHAGSDDLRALRRGAGDGVHDAPAARRAWAQLYCSRVGSTGPSRDNVMRHQGILGNLKILSPLFL
uniref:Leucine-rich repeat-containing N-terminal plant-type domain-containing protein n=1 Tax=Oryza rufipogon TaxID=4529 RepID=A0A0E0QT36_ORYRU